MHHEDLFFSAFVYLLAAVISVPLAARLGLGSVLGYLIAGAIIGPFVLGLVGQREGSEVMHFAEFGVVMMLFIVGLELQPSRLWKLRGDIFGLGGLQVLLTTGLIAGIAMAGGQAWQYALVMGMILSLSSTAIVLQSLNEKGLINTHGGQSAFSVLLFQDIAVIPILAIIPIIAQTLPIPEIAGETGPMLEQHDTSAHENHDGHTDAHGHETDPKLSGWQQAVLVLGAVGAIIAGGRFLVRPAFRLIALSGQHEVFVPAALVLVVGIALAMNAVGLSPALGTFLAGVVLADNEYRHQIESDIEPFKSLLLGVFFISVGASIDFQLILDQPLLITALVLGLIAIKAVVLFILAAFYKLDLNQRFLFSMALAQGGEFAFVIFIFAVGANALPVETTDLLIAAVALSMAVTPVLMVLHQKVIQPHLLAGKAAKENRAEDEIKDGATPVVIAGYGRFGNVVGRLLKSAGVEATVLDMDPDQVDMLRRLGMKLYFGDAARVDMLRAARVQDAKVVVIALDDRERTLHLVDLLKEHFPHVKIVARASDRAHAYELLQRGVEYVHRETTAAALDTGVDVLRCLGMRANRAVRMAQSFKKREDHSVRRIHSYWGGDEKKYYSLAKQLLDEMERILKDDAQAGYHQGEDIAWDTSSLADEIKESDEQKVLPLKSGKTEIPCPPK